MKATAVSSISVAVLVATARSLPVDSKQYHLISPDHAVASLAEDTATNTLPAQTSSPTELDKFLSSIKSIFADVTESKGSLAGSCFCANGAICCNTTNGLDCTQGLCGL
ncbi:hypothetical protein C8035_v006220 [Colletotrichum spinosum]|uniref:Hydrophobin n=1 Tax=Colletotrichum spinosum TaxID=1347390 RepID=A0A4R8Q6T6_9PEZI|nr:hypothetical protein C8035_v006220 [Colletotrichum spinosum]